MQKYYLFAILFLLHSYNAHSTCETAKRDAYMKMQVLKLPGVTLVDPTNPILENWKQSLSDYISSKPNDKLAKQTLGFVENALVKCTPKEVALGGAAAAVAGNRGLKKLVVQPRTGRSTAR
jgi:hypothetical protein